MENILIIGAGAVGQVYGHYLQRGGADVSFLVKEKYKDDVEKGFTLYRCRRSGLGGPEKYQAKHVFTDYAQLKEHRFDSVWLTMSSAGLRGGWLKELKKFIGDATLVMLQPDLDDRDYVLQFFPQDQVVYGLVNFLSYQTPLPDLPEHHPDADKKGIAYLMLPMMAAEFSGNPERLPQVMEALSSGRFPVKAQQNVPRIYADRSAWMIPLVALLEIENWSFKRLSDSKSLEAAVEGAKQALAIVAAKFHRPLNWTERGFNLFVVRLMLPLIKWLAPMDAESYLKFQFRKTKPQTRIMLEHFIEQGHKLNMPTGQLEKLLHDLPPEHKQAA